MSENCSNNCEHCSENCGERTKEYTYKNLNQKSRVKKVFAVVSGKGGVGKSLMTATLSSAARRKGYHTGILDADITGPSIPKMFGIHEHAMGKDGVVYPVKSITGISVMSINLLIENETDPVVWRGPLISETVKQFWTDVFWDDIDYLFVDMPPGTGDVPLTVFQSIPVDGIIIVSSPQELVGMIVEKAVKMANMMGVPIVGIVENMSYVTCEDCGKKIYVFGESHIDSIAKEHGIPNYVSLPMIKEVASLCDQGKVEDIKIEEIDNFLDCVIS